MKSLMIESQGNQLSLHGFLTRVNIDQKLISKSFQYINKPDVAIDLHAIEKVDTAGLAYLLLLVEQAKENKYVLSFHNIPVELSKLAHLSAVDSFLSVA